MASPKSNSSKKNNHTGLKVLIMALSMVGTVSGWGYLAVSQAHQTKDQQAQAEATLLARQLQLMAQAAPLRSAEVMVASTEMAKQAKAEPLPRDVPPRAQPKVASTAPALALSRPKPAANTAPTAVNRPATSTRSTAQPAAIANAPANTMPPAAAAPAPRPRVVARTRSSR